jgi:trigger factor
MKTLLNTLEGLKRSLVVELPIDTFNEKTNKIMQNLAKQARVDGFRKGKVPATVLRQRFGANAKADATNEIVTETLPEALADAQISPATQPSLTKVESEDSDNFIYTIEFEVFPEISVSSLAGLTIDQISAKVTEEDEEKSLQDLQDRATEYKSVKRKSKEGDRLIIDFEGLLEGESFEGGAAEGFEIILGRGAMIDGFEQGLIDVASGKELEIKATFPEDYHVENLAGREAIFKVKVNEVGSPKQLKLDDELANKYGEKDFETMKSRIANQMQIELASRVEQQNKGTTFTALLEANSFEVPEASIDAEANNMLKDMESRMEQQGIPSNNKMSNDLFREEATRRVKLGLLVNKIAKDYEIKPEKEQVDAKLKEISMSYGESAPQMIEWYNSDPSRLENIESIVVEQLVVEHITSEAKVNIKEKTFQEIMGPQN